MASKKLVPEAGKLTNPRVRPAEVNQPWWTTRIKSTHATRRIATGMTSRRASRRPDPRLRRELARPHDERPAGRGSPSDATSNAVMRERTSAPSRQKVARPPLRN
ncbi:MAG TPA: hypothetical protein VFV94_05085 [Polyangiaceae bacterium]|nr:hypothetical protein [Polyangiaceae bacterium]